MYKASGVLGEREGYPDFDFKEGYRIELKGLFKNNPNLSLKCPPTPREASARLTQKVTKKNVKPDNDFLLLVCYELSISSKDKNSVTPKIIDFQVFPVIELVEARDSRLISSNGMWFGNYETPVILSKRGKEKVKSGIAPDKSGYGRKESEGYDFNEDTNFGKMKRIPHKQLQLFLKKHDNSYIKKGDYPIPWTIS